MRKTIIIATILLVVGMAFSAHALTVTANWTANSESDLAGYNIYRSTSSGSGFTKLNPSLITNPSYIDTVNGEIESTFYYVVSAVDSSGNESGYSNEANVRIDTSAPQPPNGITVNIQ
ncbi:MAG: hypothetical protein JXO49_12080 [Deltaproteobacteria bacterium]|nr:hypothetical protein [Candidatus Anaeroferrophillus wilburensis]MBN2890072.1 hypothetical protein [Deltaproteobacteria bacterium]